MSEKPSFFAELKRRNVYKVAVAYVVVAWLLLQAASIFLPAFDAPSWVMKFLIVVILFGFPIVLVLSWAFEITPEGIKREEDVAPNESITHKTGRKIVRITIALAVLAAGLFAFQFLRPKIARTTEAAGTPASPTAAVARSEVDQKSVAVLAFANLSEEKGNESFADSVSEELLNVLGKVRGLKVTARTSAFHFKGKDTPVPEIARQLGVAYVVEGSVRRSGEKVRIAAQLIKAADGFQVWSDDFNRDLKDIFAVQEEIAGLIAKNLELKLGVTKQTAPNPEAYQLYLEAVRLWGLRNAASLDRAEQLLQRALALQPDFARAAAAMGFVLSVRSTELGNDPVAGEGRALNERALQWAERALALDPDLAEGYAAKGNVLDNLGRWTEGKEAYRRSIELDPNFATGHQWYARSLSQEGYLDEAMVEMKRAVELDPLAPRILDNYGGYLIWRGKYPEALEVLDQALAIQPGSPQANFFKGVALVKAGRAEEGRSILETLAQQPDAPEWTPVSLAQAFLATGRRREAEALLQHPPEENFYRGLLLCALGRGEEAVPLLKPVVSIYRDMILWSFQDVMPRESPEFHRKLAEWDMTESWQRAEAVARKKSREESVMTLQDFFAELRRRNVYKVAVAYVVVAWLLLQAASIFLPAFDAPSWVMKFLIVVISLGLPVALVLSWAFELTPEGIKLESEVTPSQSITRRTGRRIVGITIVLAVLAAGLMIFQIMRPKTSTVSGKTDAPSVEPPIESKSIAVLPFENLSHDPENAYFSEGVQDEILTRLAKIGDFKVISRTSTEKYKSAPGNLREIAHQLGVAHILEGSVQKSTDQVRVNVQLINALNDTHLWAETYDRKLTDIFTVESEIAKTVAENLQAKLNGRAEKVLAARPTENPEAHQLYLKGRFFWNKRTTENLRRAIDYFQQAIEKDPGYALAYAGLADAHALLPIYASTAPNEDVPAALAAARKAVELDDSLAETHTSLANALLFNVQLAAAEPEFRRAIELNPNYATAHQWYGECLQGEGRFPEAVHELRRAQELDPLSLIINASYGCVLGESGQSEEGIAELRKTLEMDPTFWVAHEILGGILEGKGDLTGAAAEYEKSMQQNWTPNGAARLASVNARLGRKADVRKTLDNLATQSRQHWVPPYALAVIHLALGEKEEALRLLEKSLDERSIFLQGDYGSLKTDKRLDPLRNDPRFQKLVERFMSGKSG